MEDISRPLLAPEQYSSRDRSHPSFSEILESEELSRNFLEEARWPDGPQCLRCHAKAAACKLTTRPGLWTCKACRNCQYSVTSGTPLHGTRVSLSSWLMLFHAQEIKNQRLGISQVGRRLGVGYLTAKSMLGRLDAMRSEMPEMADRMREMLGKTSHVREPHERSVSSVSHEFRSSASL